MATQRPVAPRAAYAAPAAALASDAYREVLATTAQMQLVAMAIPPGGEIPAEAHPGTSQYFQVLSGALRAEVGGAPAGPPAEVHRLGPGGVLLVPAGARHRVVAEGAETLRLATVYAPPEHPPGLRQKRPV